MSLCRRSRARSSPAGLAGGSSVATCRPTTCLGARSSTRARLCRPSPTGGAGTASPVDLEARPRRCRSGRTTGQAPWARTHSLHRSAGSVSSRRAGEVEHAVTATRSARLSAAVRRTAAPTRCCPRWSRGWSVTRGSAPRVAPRAGYDGVTAHGGSAWGARHASAAGTRNRRPTRMSRLGLARGGRGASTGGLTA